MNLRPSGYEPDELPGCSTPRQTVCPCVALGRNRRRAFVMRCICLLQTWRRPTLPRLETKYHRRWGVSRPSSEWDRVQPPRQNHQVGKGQMNEKLAPAHKVSMSNENNQADRAISTGKLHTLLRFHTRPINVVVFHDSQGILVFRWVSRLDAFSGYPVRI